MLQQTLPLFGFRQERSLYTHVVTAIVVVTFIVAGSTYNPFAKLLSSALSPLSLLFLSETLTMIFTIGSFGLFPIIDDLKKINRRKMLALIIVGITSGTLAPLLWFSGLSSSSAVNASLFGNTEMVFLILGAIIFLKERWTPSHIIAAVTITMGVLTITLKGFSEGISIQTGDLLIIIAGLTFSIGSMLYRLFLHTEGIHLTLFVRSAIAIVTFFIISPFLPAPLGEELKQFPLLLIPALFGFAFIARFLNVYTFYIALERIPVSVVSLLGTFHMIGGALFAYVLLGESLQWYHYQGGGLIILGTFLVEAKGVFSSLEYLEAHLRQRLHHRV